MAYAVVRCDLLAKMAIVLAVAFAAVGCSSAIDGRACTLIGCESGLLVRLQPNVGWPEGRYRFEIVANGDRVSCTASLPLPACGTSAITCDRTDIVRITESGCALAPSGQSFPEIRFDAKLRPNAVTIDVFRNDAAVGRSQLAPQFQTVQPNGEGCDPICEQASATMQLTL